MVALFVPGDALTDCFYGSRERGAKNVGVRDGVGAESDLKLTDVPFRNSRCSLLNLGLDWGEGNAADLDEELASARGVGLSIPHRHRLGGGGNPGSLIGHGFGVKESCGCDCGSGCYYRWREL